MSRLFFIFFFFLFVQIGHASEMGSIPYKNFITPVEFVLRSSALGIATGQGIIRPWDAGNITSEMGVVLNQGKEYRAFYIIGENSIFYNTPLTGQKKKDIERHIRENGIGIIYDSYFNTKLFLNTKIFTGSIIDYSQKKYGYGVGYGADISLIKKVKIFSFALELKNIIGRMYWDGFENDDLQKNTNIAASIQLGEKDGIILSGGKRLQKGSDYDLGCIVMFGRIFVVFGTDVHFESFRFGAGAEYSSLKLSLSSDRNFGNWLLKLSYFI